MEKKEEKKTQVYEKPEMKEHDPLEKSAAYTYTYYYYVL